MTERLPTKRQIADALMANMSRAIQDVGRGLLVEGWPVPEDYTLRLAVSWPRPGRLGEVALKASIGAQTIEVRTRIDRGAQELRVAYLEVARDIWSRYVLEEQPDFVASLRSG